MSDKLTEHDISFERYREYDFGGRVYRIDNPVSVFLRAGGTTHRVLDRNGIVHCVPAPGSNGCVLRWENQAGGEPVRF